MSFVRNAILRDDAQLSEFIENLRKDCPSRIGTADFPSEWIRSCSAYEDLITKGSGNGSFEQSLRYYTALGFGCLTTAFIMTQRHAAVRRIESCPNPEIRAHWMSRVVAGDFFTVGISHLTTSRQHLESPAVVVKKIDDRWVLRGTIPWVTGATKADGLVVGAVEQPTEHFDSRKPAAQHLFLIPSHRAGVTLGPGISLMALSSSCTDVVHLEDVELDDRHHLHGPSDNVIAAATPGGGAGGFQTSALALGLAATAIEYLEEQSQERSSLCVHVDNLQRSWHAAFHEMIQNSAGQSQDPAAVPLIRKRANELALNATQSALAAAKGAGFVLGHPVERWCREAMFFLVWSCPRAVAEAHLCSFANRIE